MHITFNDNVFKVALTCDHTQWSHWKYCHLLQEKRSLTFL